MIPNYARTAVFGAIFVCVTASAALAQTTQDTTTAATPAPTKAPSKAKYSLPNTVSAHAYPAATATPNPGGLTFSGKVRAYSFDRVNHVQNSSNPDRHATNFGIEPHLDYRIGNTNLNIGYSYLGADPFGVDGTKAATNAHIDNTLGGFTLDSPVHEAYIQYKDPTTQVTIGNQELNYFWTPASDSRIQPASYQAFDTSFNLYPGIQFGLTDIVRFQARNSSNFEPNTLLTANYDGASVLSKYTNVGAQTPGTLRVALNFKPVSNLSLTAEDYQFYDIANLTYGELKYGFAPKLKQNPYIAAQYVTEVSEGQKQVGKLDNQTVGAQIGATVAKGVLFTLSGDVAPWHYAYVKTSAAETSYFLPAGGSASAEKVGNEYKVAYGGIASPYTDSYASDPIYTTMLTQGMVERRSAGESYKAALGYVTPNQQFRFTASDAFFNYSNAIPVAGVSAVTASEFNLDGTYYINKVKPGKPYHGLFARVRYGPRTVPVIPYNFEYQRFQLEYDF